MKTLSNAVVWAVVSLGWAAASCSAQTLFSKRVGKVEFAEVKKAEVLEVPFLTWGGDVATFYANGGIETKADSIYGKMGLKLKLVNGDNFTQQVRNYVSGKTPFVRGTFSMLGQASEVLNTNAKTKPVVFLHMTWSAGDHMVARSNCKTLNDLKGKKVVLQSDGPHVGMLDDVLRTAGLKWKDITVVWVKELTGKDSAPEKFRADPSIEACFAISPDMLKLTGGLGKTGTGGEKVGTGAEKTVKGAHVLVSTAHMKRSIADLYAVRKDFYDANKSTIEKFTAGYLKACDELINLKAQSRKDKAALVKYRKVLRLTQDILGKETLPTEPDADGLIGDAVFVGLPGNRAFFKDRGNPSGFEAKQKHALDLAVGEKYAEARTTLLPVDFNYKQIAKLADLPAEQIDQPPRPAPAKPVLGETIYTFVITFEANEKEFPEDRYGDDFKRAVAHASLFGNAIITIRGHTDPALVLRHFIEAGIEKKLLTRKEENDKDNYYFKDGKKLDLSPANVKNIVELIRKTDFKCVDNDPKETLELNDSLSRTRADRVHQALLRYASSKKLILDKNQVQPVGVSILEPLVVDLKNHDVQAKNRRVEFRISAVRGKIVVPTEKTIYDY